MAGSTWYVSIYKEGDRHKVLVASYGEMYRNFAELARGRGIHVVAEKFGVTTDVLEKISSNGKRGNADALTNLLSEINAGRIVDAQEALTELCNY